MGKIKVTQVKSAIKKTCQAEAYIRGTRVSEKLHQTIEVEATPQIRGMVSEGIAPGGSRRSEIVTSRLVSRK